MHEGFQGLFHLLPACDPLLSAFLFLALFGFTLPIPEELALVLAGLSLRGAGSPFVAALAVAWLALVAADLGYYSIARFAGPRLLRIRPLRAILGANRIEESEKYFARRGPRIIFLCRFVVGLRAAAIMASGFLRYPLGRFLARDLPALVIGVTAWLGVGYSIGIQVEGGIGAIGNALSIGGPAAAIVAAILVYRSVRRDRLRLAADAVG